MNKCIGIDLGTTNTVAAYFEDSSKIVLNERGERMTPSIVSFNSDGIVVGNAAKNQILVNPKGTIYNFKVNMGQGYVYKVNGSSYRTEDIASYILKNVKNNAEKFLETEVEDAVITVPAYFSEVQRRATVEAGMLAGLNVRAILNEPTAAAIAYAFEKKIDGIFLVYDLGGGTFDVTLLEKQGDTYTVLSIKGQSHLGGNDFNNLIEEDALDYFKKEAPSLDFSDPVITEQIKDKIEEAKKNLSTMDKVNITLPFLDGKHLNYELSREHFNEMIIDLINSTVSLTKECIKDAQIDDSKISKIILSGGSTRIPLVKESLLQAFPLLEVLNTLNQDEVVAIGAGIHAFSLSENRSLIKFKDVTPYSLGLEIKDDGFFTLIKRNSPLPIVKKMIFTTTNDFQDEIEIHVLQGEQKKSSLNYSIARFFFKDIQPELKGIPKIEILFNLDENGILNVSARDLSTNLEKTVEIKITSSKNATIEDEDNSFNFEEDLKNRNDLTAYLENDDFKENSKLEESIISMIDEKKMG